VTVYESSHRFLRPTDLGRTRRNRRRLQARRVLAIFANLVLVAVLGVSALWAWRHARENVRFAVQRVEITGVVHSSRSEVEDVARTYRGVNLFRLDIENVRRGFAQLPWVQRAAVEKKLPDTLLVRLSERTPVALLAEEGRFHYVDAEGTVFAELTPEIGNRDLPLISNAAGSQVRRCVEFLSRLERTDRPLYSRVSEIAPVDGGGYRLFDRSLATSVIVGEERGAEKWRLLHGITAAERIGPGTLEYADLRFRERVILKPRAATALKPAPLEAVVPALGAAIAPSRD
jgi:cell division protein FtsQ